MRNILRKNKERQSPAASHASSSSTPAGPEDQAARRPSEASSVDTQGTASGTEPDGLFADDASTIRPTRSYAESFFSDTASTLHEDAYACLGPQDGPANSSSGRSAAGASQVTLVNVATAPAGGASRVAAVAVTRHEPRDFEPFNAFDEVARMSQRERVALAVKNSMGPQYDELYWVGTVPAARRKSGRSG